MKEIVRQIIDADMLYSGDGMMFALYLCMLVLIVFVFKESKIKKAFAYPSVIMLIAVYFLVPFLRRFIDIEMQARFFWLLLTPVVTAVGFTYLIYKLDRKRKRFALIALLMPIFLICGSFQISSYRFKPSENLYRLPQAAVDITHKVLSEKNAPRLIVPYTIAYPFRQLSTDVYLLYGEDATFGRILHAPDKLKYLAEEMEHVIPDLNQIVSAMEEYECDYIVFDTVYTELCENGNININNYPADPTYVGDRTSTIGYDDIPDIQVIGTEGEPYWDLTAYNLEYNGTFGQYVLYEYIKK